MIPIDGGLSAVGSLEADAEGFRRPSRLRGNLKTGSREEIT
jgi:hypothetical protein